MTAAAVLASAAPLTAGSVAAPVAIAGRSSSRSMSLTPSAQRYTGYAAVAAATTPTNPGVFAPDPALHLLRRATFGPRPSDIASIRRDGIDAWLSRQLNPGRIADPLGDAAWSMFPLASATPAQVRAQTAAYSWDAMIATAMATLGRQIFSTRQLYEQVADVFANHLHVAIPAEGWDTSPSYIGDVIRPFAMGRYRDMLLAAMRHPAMLLFLNNDVSTKAMVNENLGRELLELHTVGLGGGYTEAEVVQSAKVLTGRTITDGAFSYNPDAHWTGPLAVMGWSSPNATAAGGLAVGDSYLAYLANHPATARNIARKLAVRFVSDQPPAALVDRMAQSYLDHDTDIRAVLDTLFRSPEFWASVGQKSRRPLEDLVGAARVLDMLPGPKGADVLVTIQTLYWVVRDNGHAPLGWDPPNGYPDVAAAWNNAGSLVNRFTMHRALVNQWWGGMAQAGPTQLVPVTPGMTAGQWVDALSLRLLGQPMAPAHRDAVLSFAQVTAGSPVANALWQAWGAVPLLFDSPYYQLR